MWSEPLRYIIADIPLPLIHGLEVLLFLLKMALQLTDPLMMLNSIAFFNGGIWSPEIISSSFQTSFSLALFMFSINNADVIQILVAGRSWIGTHHLQGTFQYQITTHLKHIIVKDR